MQIQPHGKTRIRHWFLDWAGARPVPTPTHGKGDSSARILGMQPDFGQDRRNSVEVFGRSRAEVSQNSVQIRTTSPNIGPTLVGIGIHWQVLPDSGLGPPRSRV